MRGRFGLVAALAAVAFAGSALAGSGGGRDSEFNANYFRVTDVSADFAAHASAVHLEGVVHRRLVEAVPNFVIGLHVEFQVQVSCRSTSDSSLLTYDFVVDELKRPEGLTVTNDGPSLSQRGNRLTWSVDAALTLDPHYRCPPAHEFEEAHTKTVSLSVWPATAACPECAPPQPTQQSKTLVFSFTLPKLHSIGR